MIKSICTRCYAMTYDGYLSLIRVQILKVMKNRPLEIEIFFVEGG